jgi:hypothetical protein
MKGGMLLLILFVTLIGSPAISGQVQAAMAASFGTEHSYGIGAATFQGTNHTWNWSWWPWGGNDKKPKTRTVPVPGTLLLFGAGLAGFVLWRSRQDK